MADKKPTLHHLNKSQSQRILWLLEELNIPYDVKLYTRIRGRSPPELAKVHPLAKSPTLVTADGQVLIESMVIVKYLIDTYDTENKFKGDNSFANDPFRDDRLTSFAISSLLGRCDTQIVFDAIDENSPSIIRPVTKAVRQKLFKLIVEPEFLKMLDYLQDQLGDHDFFMGGANPSRPDFMLSFPIDMIEQRQWMDLSNYPKLKAWHDRCLARDAWKRGIENGNDYDMATWKV